MIVEFAFIEQIIISLAIGALLGMEREHTKGQSMVGIRTFALTSLLGTLFVTFANLTNSSIQIVLGFITVLLFSLILYYSNVVKFNKIGLTTALALIISYVLGVFVGYGSYSEAVFITIIITMILFAKSKLHNLVDKLSSKEMLDFLEFLVLVGVVYPLIPTAPVNFGFITLDFQALWVLTLFISIINFLGFFGLKVLKLKKNNIHLIAFLGGMISTTATLLNISSHYKKICDENVLAGALLISAGPMMIRNLLVVGILAPLAIKPLIIPIIITSAVLVGAGYLMSYNSKTRKTKVIDTPFEVENAVSLAIKIFALMVFLQLIDLFVPSFYYLAVFLGGVLSSASTTASIATMVSLNQISELVATNAIAISIVSSLLFGNSLMYLINGCKSAVKKALPLTISASILFLVLFLAL